MPNLVRPMRPDDVRCSHGQIERPPQLRVHAPCSVLSNPSERPSGCSEKPASVVACCSLEARLARGAVALLARGGDKVGGARAVRKHWHLSLWRLRDRFEQEKGSSAACLSKWTGDGGGETPSKARERASR